MTGVNLFLLIVLLVKSVICLEREMTVNIEARREDCFFQSAKAGDTIDFEYQVIDGGHGDLDITFHLVDPTGRILVADYKKTENNHRVDAGMNGDYKFCFDNSFSSYNTKTVFFEMIVEGDDNSEWDDENIDMQGLRAEDVYEMKVQDIQQVITNVRNHLNKVRHIQDLLKSIEARDRNVVEENFFKVNTFSMVQICTMLVVGCIQVVMVRSLFDDNSKVHKIWKNLNRR
ncbi:transmembrane emp24 domain-containing protein 5 [Tribolium castaneum]|uniref:Transmembrane emp24 domain-containing protein 5-like Protein n=1 Tax=Tribolium castaneum TaxID=7070 RepID=D6WA28_TRICA|nr:PREDICTED: transmembrane emp24 domain-containing protein 5 [Tribolium castaneum]EEZ98577.1 Transmembrane emp24 domain-containing protein 5-like Protein [Tribolium castaneum]|eukprot:XP_966878.1 PREDICTED: transmembrane emp24 domain-containing protein 5 [Tribolium castaneum]